MENSDKIKGLFREQLGSHEVPVRPELWEAVSAKVAAGSVASSGISIVSKLIIGAVSTAAIVTGVYLISQEKEEISKPESKSVVVLQEERLSENKEYADLFDNDKNKTVSVEEKEKNKNQENHTETVVIDTLQPKTTPSYTPLKERKREEKTVVAESQENKENKEKETRVQEEQAKKTGIKQEKQSIEVVLPNVFSPNNDGQHDEFFIDFKDYEIQDFNMVIMDKSNKVVYTSNDPKFNWNGMDLNGNPVQPGTYLYYFTGVVNDKTPISKFSSLQIIR
jgi:gliding motility-associated-like protein